MKLPKKIVIDKVKKAVKKLKANDRDKRNIKQSN